MCDLKVAQINIQHSLIWELRLYNFELVHNTVEATKNICCVVDEGAVDHSTVTRWWKEFCLGYKNLHYQAKSGRPKTVDSEAVLQAIRGKSGE